MAAIDDREHAGEAVDHAVIAQQAGGHAFGVVGRGRRQQLTRAERHDEHGTIYAHLARHGRSFVNFGNGFEFAVIDEDGAVVFERRIAKEPLGVGVTASLKVSLQQGEQKQSPVLKIVDQMRPGLVKNAAGEMELDFQDSWRTEIAAYELDKLIGLGMVPATVERTIEGKHGSLQFWVTSKMNEEERLKKKISPADHTLLL